MLQDDRLIHAFVNSAIISTLATIFSLLVTVSSGYMLSRFKGRRRRPGSARSTCSAACHTSPGSCRSTSWRRAGASTIPISACSCRTLPFTSAFFSWLMKGFFDGIDPSMEHAALIDGCTRWGAFGRVAPPSAIPAISALAVLCWLFTWNEFLFALILTGNKVPVITVVMAQFVTEMRAALEPDGCNGGHGAGARLPAGSVRPEIRDPGV